MIELISLRGEYRMQGDDATRQECKERKGGLFTGHLTCRRQEEKLEERGTIAGGSACQNPGKGLNVAAKS